MKRGPQIRRTVAIAATVLVAACNSETQPDWTATPTPDRSPRVRAAETRFGLKGPVADIWDRGIWMGLPGARSFSMFDWEGNHFEFSFAGTWIDGPAVFYWGTHHPRLRPGRLIPPGSPEEDALLLLMANWVNRTLYPEEIEFILAAEQERIYCDQITSNNCEMAACVLVSWSTKERFKILTNNIVGRQ